MANGEKLAWANIPMGIASVEVQAAWKAVGDAKEAFEQTVVREMDAAGVIPADKTVRFGYNFDKPAVALVDKPKAKAGAVDLATWLSRAANAGDRH